MVASGMMLSNGLKAIEFIREKVLTPASPLPMYTISSLFRSLSCMNFSITRLLRSPEMNRITSPA